MGHDQTMSLLGRLEEAARHAGALFAGATGKRVTLTIEPDGIRITMAAGGVVSETVPWLVLHGATQSNPLVRKMDEMRGRHVG